MGAYWTAEVARAEFAARLILVVVHDRVAPCEYLRCVNLEWRKGND